MKNTFKYSLRITLLFLFLPFSLSAQDLLEAEKKLSALFEMLKTTQSKEESLDIHQQIETTLKAVLQNDESFNYPFSSLNFLGKIYSDDHLLRIYSWNIPFYDGTFHYGGIIQQKKNNIITALNIKDATYMPPNNKIIDPQNWYGALYYRAIPVTDKKSTYYTLLGWAGNDDLTNFKIIDALTIDNHKIRFGLPVFKKGNRTFYRALFEYGDQYTMTLEYDKKSKQIIFDHLAPSSRQYEGIYTHYGPDFSYDSFQLKKKEWIFKENVDARNSF